MSELELLIREIADDTAKLIGPYWSEKAYEVVFVELLRKKGVKVISQKQLEIQLPALDGLVFSTLKEDLYLPTYRCVLELKHQATLAMSDVVKFQIQNYINLDDDVDCGYVIIFQKKTDEPIPKKPSDYKFYSPFISSKFC
jgi:hypothetical protein